MTVLGFVAVGCTETQRPALAVDTLKEPAYSEMDGVTAVYLGMEGNLCKVSITSPMDDPRSEVVLIPLGNEGRSPYQGNDSHLMRVTCPLTGMVIVARL